MVFMTALTAFAALSFLGVVAFALTKIVAALDSIGGRGSSYLAKLRLGLRAIERETSHLPAAAPLINTGLRDVAGGLTAVDATLGDLHKALEAQER
ncbi:MAG: hypothetical protein ACR2RF_10660 [Geminicoccaceae bacterium]